MKSIAIMALAATVGAASSAAEGATITRNFQFFATNFAAAAPLQNIGGTFSVTFDPAVNSSGILNSLSIAYPGLAFSAANTGFTATPGSFGVMTIGGLPSGVGSLATGTSDFVLQFIGAGSSPFSYLPLSFRYSTGAGQAWSGDFQIDVINAAVPEPATWALMIAGFGLIGASLRTRRRAGARRPA